MHRALITLALLLLAPYAIGADWLKLDLPNTEDQYFYDRSKLVVQGNEVTYWKKVLFKQPQPVKNKLAHSGLMRERIDCKDHTLRLLSYLYHDAQGAVIDYVADSEKEGVPIIPETIGDWFEQTLCVLTIRGADTDAWGISPGIDSHVL